MTIHEAPSRYGLQRTLPVDDASHDLSPPAPPPPPPPTPGLGKPETREGLCGGDGWLDYPCKCIGPKHPGHTEGTRCPGCADCEKDRITALDPYEVRVEAERIVGEDRVPTDVLRRIIREHGDGDA